MGAVRETMRFPLLFASLLVCSVLVIYIISSQTEKETCTVPAEISSRKEHVINFRRFDSKDPAPTSKLGHKTGKTGESPFLSHAEKLFKLYDGVGTFVMFIGYPRSSHSLVGAILDAHPEIIIPHEYDLMAKWTKYQSSKLKEKNLQKYVLFYDLHQCSLEQSMFGIRAGNNNSLTTNISGGYNYNIPGLWQGSYQRRIKVIGDKKGGTTSMDLTRTSYWRILEEISQVVQVPMKFIHVTRNPFDNIATMMLHKTRSRDTVREEGVKINNSSALEAEIEYYFKLAASNQRVRERYGDAVIDTQGHETVLRPKETLQRLCDHLGVTCSEDYLEKCSRILYGAPSVTRDKAVWTEEQKARVTKMMKNYTFLKEYSFDKYPN
ncbi:hypothetical protein OS493_016623 [Desmophyllum pertusum]|uniref:Protein-tyrosine sulfotransferase n=1 Tax=Desmophyllum pertusum TaxID=174260 RepID=A0A9W9ZD98_9CNID|nr:hypothetical protein OS493_016623 [Desmophyllum pertusum]